MGNTKTYMLMAAMTALFMGLGALMGGMTGAVIALMIAAAMNVFAFWNSDKAVLRMAGAREVNRQSAPDLVRMVEDLADRAHMPHPKVYIIETEQPNAFATGRDPNNAAVAATTGLLRALSPQEVAAVMAHELAHIKNRDTLTMTITATMAGAISMLANFGMFFGGSDRDRPMGMVGQIALMILAPMAAGIVQMAISRSREYEADRLGAEICGNPDWLAQALRKIERLARGEEMVVAEKNPAIAHMFIINPLNGHGADNLFSTHPSTQNRVAALAKLPMGQAYSFGRGPVPQSPSRRASPPPPPPAATVAPKSSIPSAGRRRGGNLEKKKGPWL